MAQQNLKRRDFLRGAVAASAAFTILPSGFLSGQNAPSNKLNIALIGADGRARAHYRGLAGENVVALCDVDAKHIAHAAKEFPGAKHYSDWRKCLEQKDLDAVVCCTPDFTHAFIGTWAMNRGLHLYLEKPMGLSVEEVRIVRDVYRKNKDKIAVQHGTQRHSKPNFDRVRELIQDGAVGQLSAVHAWGNRQLRKPGYPKGKGKPPKHLNYDLWLGPAPHHDYSPEYFSGGPGANCLQWNMYWDFGTGQIGDMGSHTMDLAWNAIDADIPTSAEAEGEKYNSEVTPVELSMSFKVPANDWRPEIDVVWHQGGAMPTSPRGFVDLDKIGHGVMFKGDKGFLISSFDNRILIPHGDDADMSYYNRRPADKLIEPMGDFQAEWINACKTDLKTSCDFEYAGSKMELMMLGLVAYRAGKKLDYDGKTGRVTNDADANQYLKRNYRDGWIIDG
jgi:predicted dehydrogenase